MTRKPTSTTVLEAIAEVKGVDIVELSPPLYETVDPEALDKLFQGGHGEVHFEYLDYEVTVDHDDNVEVSSSTFSE